MALLKTSKDPPSYHSHRLSLSWWLKRGYIKLSEKKFLHLTPSFFSCCSVPELTPNQVNGLLCHIPTEAYPFSLCTRKSGWKQLLVFKAIPANVHKVGLQGLVPGGSSRMSELCAGQQGQRLCCQTPTKLCAAWAALFDSWDLGINMKVHTMWTRALAAKPLGFKFLMFWTVI